MNVRHGCLGGRDEIQFAEILRIITFRHAVILIPELRKLSHAYETVFANHEWRCDFSVAVFRNVKIQEKLDQRSFQSRAPIRVEQKAAA